MNLAHGLKCSVVKNDFAVKRSITHSLIHHLSTQDLEFANLLNDQIQWVVAEEIFQNLYMHLKGTICFMTFL